MLTRKASFLGLTLVFLAGFALGGEPIPNWPAPATWSPARSREVSAMDVTNPLPFIGLAPCRILDTRGNNAPIQGGIFAGGDLRNYTIPPICGVPVGVAAVSLNFTVTGPGQTAAGFLLAWPTGGAVPQVSILNWDRPQQQIANAAVVPTNGSGSITVNVSAPTHVIMDINGYYSSVTTSNNPFILTTNRVGSAMILTNNSTTCVTHCGLDVVVLGFNSNAISVVNNGTGAGVGVFGQSNTTGNRSAGVYGFGAAAGSAGTTFGVFGDDRSNAFDSAGVKGQDGSGSPTGATGYFQAGVRGDSAFNYGVLGVSRYVGVSGALVDTSGNVISAGYLGDVAGGPWGVYAYGNIGATGAKPFVEVHPTDPNRQIRYVALEGPEAGTYFRGRSRLSHGWATISVPESFSLVSDEEGLTVQITPIGEPVTIAVVKVGLDEIVVRASKDVEFFYTVNGVRQTFKDWQVIVDGGFIPDSPHQKLPRYFSEAQKQRLIANGTYNPDGTVNMQTAERLGWAKAWREREEQARAAATAAAATYAATPAETK